MGMLASTLAFFGSIKRISNAWVSGYNMAPWLEARRWTDASGMGTVYAAPASITVATVNGSAFTPDGKAIVVAFNVSPYVAAYPFDAVAGWGTRFSDPATLPTGNTFGPKFGGGYVAFGSYGTKKLLIYEFDSATGFGTLLADPATLPTDAGNDGPALTKTGDAVAMPIGGSPWVFVYPISGGVVGTRFTNPGTITAYTAGSCFSPDGTEIFVTSNVSPYVRAFAWNSATGFGTEFSAPTTLPTAATQTVRFSNSGKTVVLSATNQMNAYPWSSSGFGTKWSAPSTAFSTGPITAAAFTADDSSVAFPTSYNVQTYRWNDATGFGTRYTDPGGFPSGSSLGRTTSFNRG